MPSPFQSLAFIDGVGTPEMVMIFIVVLVLFGGQKLPEFARGLGKSIKEFKKAAAGVEEEFKRAMEEDERAKTATPVILPAPATQAALPAPNAPVTTGLLTISDSATPSVENVIATVPVEVPSSGGETAPLPEASPAAPAVTTSPRRTLPSSGSQLGKADV